MHAVGDGENRHDLAGEHGLAHNDQASTLGERGVKGGEDSIERRPRRWEIELAFQRGKYRNICGRTREVSIGKSQANSSPKILGRFRLS
jgi:hypothetical protein